MRNLKIAYALCIGISVITPVAARAQGITRQLMQTTDFPAGYTTVTGIATITAGSCAGSHIHPGLETSYMLEGEIILKIDGKPTKSSRLAIPCKSQSRRSMTPAIQATCPRRY